VVDNVVGWCNWSSGMSPYVECSDPSMMVDRVWVDGGGLIGFGRRFGVSLCPDGDAGSVILVA
jgi:hypothetical protein